MEEIYFSVGPSEFGTMLIAKSQYGVCAVLLGEERNELLAELQDRFPKAILVEGKVELQESMELDERGSSFQISVWKALREIPWGTTATYTDIAIKIGKPAAVRAVARACAANPLALINPCHRVVRKDGSLAGYRWGIERKQMLLNYEAATAPN